jgi:hypothetical protein
MGNGKKGIAPCGHPGEAVIGQYYQCSRGCDDLKDEEITLDIPQCKCCGSYNVDEDFQVDPMFYLFNPGIPVVDTRCNACGKCWTRN